MARHGGEVGRIVDDTVEALLRRAHPGAGHGEPSVPQVAGPRRPHQHYDGTVRPTLTPDGRNLLPPSHPARRPDLGQRLPEDHPDAPAQRRLSNYLNAYYKGTTSRHGVVGDGRTADAHRWERLSNTPLGRNPNGNPAWHEVKARDGIRRLDKFLRDFPDAPAQWREIVLAERQNLQNAVDGS